MTIYGQFVDAGGKQMQNVKYLDIEALLALHRSTFGDARMDATDDKTDDGADDATDDGDDKDVSDDDAAAADKAAEEKAAADTLADADGSEGLGEAGKRALDRMRLQRDKAREALKLSRSELDKLVRPEKNDLEIARAEGRAEAQAKAQERMLRAEIRAAAAGKLADPADAYKFLDVSKFEVDDDGNVDTEEIAEAIDDLLKQKSYLGVTQGDKQKKFQGGADAGARGKASKSQLTEADVKKLASEGKHSEIEQARVDGRLNELLGIK